MWDTSVLTTGEFARQVDKYASGHKDYPYALMIGKCFGEENLIKETRALIREMTCFRKRPWRSSESDAIHRLPPSHNRKRDRSEGRHVPQLSQHHPQLSFASSPTLYQNDTRIIPNLASLHPQRISNISRFRTRCPRRAALARSRKWP